MGNIVIGSPYWTLTIKPAGCYTEVIINDNVDGDGSFILDDAELDQLTNYLIELRGQRRVQALLEQP